MDIKQYVQNGHIYSTNKLLREKYQSWLKPIFLSFWRWEKISLDYVSLFPTSFFMGITYSYILILTNCLIKMYHYKSTISMKAKKAAKIFYQTVFRLHSLLQAIISNRDSQFSSEFW